MEARLRSILGAARTPYGLFALAGAAAIAAYAFLPTRGQAPLWEVVAFGSVAAIVLGVWLHRPDKSAPWLLLAGGVLASSAADLLWDSLYTWGGADEVALGPPDALYLAAYPLFAASLLLFGRRRQDGRGRPWPALLDTAILLIPICALAWTFLIDPVLESGTLSGLNAVQMVYPVADLALVALLIWLGLSGHASAVSYVWLLLGFLLLVPADTLTRDLLLTGEYEIGQVQDILYLGAYVAWGLAALHPSMRLLVEPQPPDERQLTGRGLVFLAAATLSTPLVLIGTWTALDDLGDRLLLEIVALIVPLLVLLRLAGIVNVVEGLSSAADAAKRNLESVLHSSPLPMCVLDLQGRVTLWNRASEEMWGWRESEVIGRPVPIEPADGEHQRAAQQAYERMLAGEPVDGVELGLVTKTGKRIEVGLWTTPLRDDSGRVSGTVTTGVDVTERNRQEQEIRYLAGHDPLTALPNRRFFEEALDEAVHRTQGSPGGALLIVDLDNFKLVNDTAGHPAGDRYLNAVSELLKHAVRPGDLVARIGGDEFGVVLHRVTLYEARQICDRILSAAAEFRFEDDGHAFDLSISIGLVPLAVSGDADEILAQADAALYEAKDQGKNRAVVRIEPVRTGPAVTIASQLAARVKDALRDGDLVLELQPIVRLPAGTVIFHEALVRMRDETGVLLHPPAFLPAAERFGLMPRVDRWLVETAFRLLEVDRDLHLFINLASSSLTDDSLLQQIANGIRDRRIAAGRLGFEVTESAAVRDLEQARRRLGELADLGCPIALDDFGSGFSSFSHLQLLPAEFVKIGESFIQGIEDSSTSRAVVRAITEVAHALGKQVIAEAVETERALEVVNDLAIEFAQGFVFGAPQIPSGWAEIGLPASAIASAS